MMTALRVIWPLPSGGGSVVICNNFSGAGFDPAYSGFGPGQLLTHESLSRCFAAGLTSYEFLGRDEGYKLAWTSATRERVRLRAFPPTLGGRVSRQAHRRLRPLWLRLRRA